MIDRAQAFALLRESNPGTHLIQHALASEAVLRALARRFNEDQDLWGVTGLLHDFDYPQTQDNPARHGLQSAELLEGKLPPEALQAIMAHNSECNGHPMRGRFDVALRCGETVTGLVVTAALVRPTGLEGMEAKSLKKKMKDKAFAASVNRDTIRMCADLDMDLDDFLTLAIEALTPIAAELGCAKQQDKI